MVTALRSRFLVLALLACFIAPAELARADEGEHRDRGRAANEVEQQVVALRKAVKVLRQQKANPRLIRALEEQIERVQHPRRKAGSERQIVEEWLEVMRLAMRALQNADRGDSVDVLEHGIHALELALEGREDEKAKRIRREAPSRAEQARALRRAARWLREHDKSREARWVAELAERFAGHAEHGHEHGHEHEHGKEHGHEYEDDEERRALRHRVATIRMAVPVLRDNDDPKLAKTLERAILTGDLMLAGREDAEARKAFERTPSLGELAEILHHAARVARKQGRGERAERIMDLSRYYRERWNDQRAEREEGERRERIEREHHARQRERDQRERDQHERERHERRRHEANEHLEELHKELHELRRRMERLQRALEEIRGR